MKDEIARVVEAARAWSEAQTGFGTMFDAKAHALIVAVDALDQAKANAQPEYEEIEHVAWMAVRDGDLVRAPNGNWYRVITSVEGSTPATQSVTMDIGGKTAGPYDRPAEARVDVRRPIDQENAAIDALAAAFGDVRAIAADQYGS